MRNRMAHLRWLAKKIGKPGIVRKDNASYGIGPGADEPDERPRGERRNRSTISGGCAGTGMRGLNWDLLQLQRRAGEGSHGTRRDRSYALTQMANALREAGYRGLRARGLKGKHIEALVRDWSDRGLSHATGWLTCAGGRSACPSNERGALGPVL